MRRKAGERGSRTEIDDRKRHQAEVGKTEIEDGGVEERREGQINGESGDVSDEEEEGEEEEGGGGGPSALCLASRRE